ncbi:integrase core domain-containing protein [Nonomuraea salmonea]
MLTQGEDVEAQALRKRGWSISAIARHLGRSRPTIRAYLNGERVPGQRRRSGADPFEPYAEYGRLRLEAESGDPHVWATTADLHRARHPKSAPGRSDRAPDWGVGGAAGPQPDDGPGGAHRRAAVLDHDRDPLFTSAFREVFTAEGLQAITTLPRTPRMNAICERVIGSLCRELLDRILILSERHLTLVLHEYLIDYNRHGRTSLGSNGPRTAQRNPSGP